MYSAGARAAGRWLVVFGRPTTGDEPARLGVTASRRVGGAVVRNRCKRRIRELYRLHQPVVCDRLELVVNARPGCESAPWEQLVLEYERCVTRLQERLERRPPASGPTRSGSLPFFHRRVDSHQRARSTQQKPSVDTDS